MSEKSTKQHRIGMANIGNTCFLNSTVQALRYTKPLAEYLCGDAWQAHRHPDRKGHELVQETSEIFKILCTEGEGRMVVPGKFVHAFLSFSDEAGFDDIRRGGQADAAEAIQILLDGIHTQQAREVHMNITGASETPEEKEYIRSLESWSSFFRKTYSPIVSIFFGQSKANVVCESCKHTTASRYEPLELMKLPIPGSETAGAPAPTLQDCIAASLATEKLEDYVCDSCKTKGTSSVHYAISRFPDRLILSLKRFTNRGAKVHALIRYNPECVDFSTWNAWPNIQNKRDCVYRVYAVIDHYGGMRGGHYNMRVRDDNGSSPEWLLYDDGSCSSSSDGGSPSADTYVIFLEKIKVDSRNERE